MWRDVSSKEKAEMIPKAAEFTGNATLYGAAMLRVASEWPVSCENSLTDTSQNRKAWIGHAAACLQMGFPEHVTRQAWGMLTEQQQVEANDMAEKAIQRWEESYERKNTVVREEVGRQMLLIWNP